MLLESTNNRLSGVFSGYVVPYFQIFEHFFNATVVVQEENPGVGHQVSEDGVYDGCLGKLQRGEADTMGNAIDYPLDIVNVSQGFIAFDEQISFTGVFPRPESVKKADFMRSIYAFQWSVYLLVWIYLLVFGVVLEVRRRLKRKLIIKHKVEHPSMEGDPGFVDVIRNFAGTNFLEPVSLSFSFLIIFLNLFSFLIFAYFNSLLNTDLVIPAKARIYEDYEQIMEHGVKPSFFGGMSYYGDLKYSKKGSKEREFWNWAVDKFGGEEKLTAETRLESLGPILPDLFGGKVLLFTGDTIALTIRSTACEVYDREFARVKIFLKTLHPEPFDWDQYQDIQVYTRKEPSAPNKIKSIIFGRRFIENAKLFALAKKLFLRGFEHGHFQANINFLARARISTEIPGFKSILGPVVSERSQIKQRCKDCNVPVPKIPDIDYLTLSNFTISSSICAALIICSFTLFSVELLMSGRPKRAIRARRAKTART